jgi:cold-inducible RNA-binding protein
MNIFVQHLAPTAVESDLDMVFGEFGTVRSSVVVRDRRTGASRGCGYVEMLDEAEAEAAIARLNGREADGLVLLIRQSTANPASVEKAYRRAAMTR